MSSATYHAFAALIDFCLIPFFVFAAILANQNLHEPSGTNGHWRSFFPSENTTNALIHITFLATAVMGGLHIASLGIDVYLIVMFRKIANMPPDMNPLEDNLTSRPKKSKHKYKDSDATLAVSEQYASKHASVMSDSTLTVSHASPDRTSKTSKRDSREPALPDVTARNISFFHTRNQSDTAFSPHNPRSARLSRAQFDTNEKGGMYQQLVSSTTSRLDVASTHEPTLAEHRASMINGRGSTASLLSPPVPPKGVARPQTGHQSNKSFVSATSTPPKSTAEQSYRDEPVSPITDDPQSDNWFVTRGASKTISVKDFGGDTRPSHQRAKSQYDTSEPISASGPPDLYNSGTVRRPRSYHPVSQSPSTHIDSPSPPPLQPLSMNPPSPLYPKDNSLSAPERDTDTYSIDSGSHYSQPSTVSSAAPAPDVPFNPRNSIGTGLRSSATPKGKYYGDLASATRGIMRGNSPAGTAPSPSIDVHD
ncbi:MAG: hypothetical protein INR71_15125, partial [Terriglobus roseus]|nr:hypothetical protein [Terriglobus roseus]